MFISVPSILKTGANPADRATSVAAQLYSASHFHKHYFSTPLLGQKRKFQGRGWMQCQLLKFTLYYAFITLPSHI